jgi:hypothetical protein
LENNAEINRVCHIYIYMLEKAVLAVRYSGRVMTDCSACPQLAKGRECTLESHSSNMVHRTLCHTSYIKTLVESRIIEIHILDCAKCNQILMIVYLAQCFGHAVSTSAECKCWDRALKFSHGCFMIFSSSLCMISSPLDGAQYV